MMPETAKESRGNMDVIVIGGGPAGVTAALRARELGASVALVERGRLGGTCTNDGCVPTRVLAKAARLLRDAEQFEEYGLLGQRPTPDFAQLLARTQHTVYTLHEKKQLIGHLEQSGVTVYANAEARFVDEHTLALNGDRHVEADRFIVCAGGHARRLPFPGAEHALTHSDVWSLKTLPQSIAMVGGAATGSQLTSIFAAFGLQVTLLDLAPRLMPLEDESVSQAIQTAFEQHGVQVITGISGVDRIEKADRTLTLHYKHHDRIEQIEAEVIVLAVGWPGNVESLNLTAASVKTERGYIVVDDYLRTSTPHIFAAGDVTGRMMLVQSASYDARLAAENAVLGAGHPHKRKIVPHGGFTDPEYGSVGLTETQARAQEECAVAVVPYTDLDRAVIDDRTPGFGKLLVSKETHRILGAHVVGEQALEIVHLVAAAMTSDMWVEQLAELEIAYPTYTAVVGLAARQIVRQLGVMPLAAQWRALGKPHIAEWERSERS
jgi:pyruvate/2-oxoglutarate dehydrogenase complex dihydrolipoamide dehydrogenase (E3) component